MKYRLEYENGLTRTIYSKQRLQDVNLSKIKIPQEGLRSITCLVS